MSSAVALIHVEAIPTAVVRRRANQSELSTVVPRLCGVVWEFVRANGLRAGRNLSVYLDCDIQLEVGVELPGPFTPQGDVVRSHTPSGLVATTTHFGPYQRLGAAHDAIRAWCEANGHTLAGPNWEIYGHWQDEWNADPSKIRTDVFYRIA